MQVIIPMSGSGQRFKDAGYTSIKPLITVHGKTFIEHVIRLFDAKDDFIFICDAAHLANTHLKTVLTNAAPNGKVIAIDSHKKGPVYAVQQAFPFIKEDEPCIINYCDFFMQWNYADFINMVTTTNCAGAIPCYTGFHPHLIPTKNVYAGCKIDATKKLIAIQEKYSFAQDKTEGHHSVGTYYFKTGTLLKYYVTHLIANDNNLNGEYYASMLYEQMLIDNQLIQVYDTIPHFCQWGTPEDLEAYLVWQHLFLNNKEYSQKQHAAVLPNTTLLLPMAGNGKRFADAGYATPKPFLLVDGVAMYQRAIADLPKCSTQIFISKIPLPQEAEKSKVIEISNTTDGQAATCVLAKDYINNTDALFIAPCDNGMVYNIDALVALQKNADVIVFTFRNNPAVKDIPNQYGWVEVAGEKVTHISCKKAISNTPHKDHAITGAFWFKQGNYFVLAAEKMIAENRKINNEFYVDECMNDCIALGYKVRFFEIEQYICWGTPNDYETHLYWNNFFNHFV
jgi:NDP-sugar pyrophosphorylase family protein